METPKINNQPKAEVEKTPQENEDILNEREQESSKRENITLEIDGQKIEAVKYYFEYPERIQKETLIKGYTKYKIPRSIFRNDEYEFLGKELSEKEKKAHEEGRYSLRDELSKKKSSLFDEKWEMQRKIQNDICHTLSNGKFPSETYNHRIQADDSSWDEENELVKEKIILGEISSISGDRFTLRHRGSGTISAVIDEDAKILCMGDFLHKKEGGYRFGEFTGSRYDYPERNDIRLRKKWDKEMSENDFNILTKDKIIISTMSGLYLSHGKTWGSMLNTPSFGFDVNEPYLKKYLNKVEEIYKKLPQDVCSEKNVNSLNHLLNDKGEHVTTEVILPIMTGNTGLPALRWCHAKYAVIPTEKNFNFLIIDHLPIKEEVNSSDS